MSENNGNSEWAPEDWAMPGEDTPQLAEDQNPIAAEAKIETPAEVISQTNETLASDSGIFREDVTTQLPLSAEEANLAAERSARKEARQQALATAPVIPPTQQPPVVEAPKPVKSSTDKFFGSLGLFLLRAVIAGILGVRAVHWLADVDRAMGTLTNTIIPIEWHGLTVLAVGILQLVIAFSLLLGLLTRVAGFGLAALMGCALAFVIWGPYSIFQDELWPGFLGEFELIMALVGALILFVGAGGWSLDRGFRSRRADAS
ncbi:MAG: DoxX family protein [Propionibacteriaceae bacterium]|nr:DoxX family protein [Propionibacteriaceae bacterium]